MRQMTDLESRYDEARKEFAAGKIETAKNKLLSLLAENIDYQLREFVESDLAHMNGGITHSMESLRSKLRRVM